MTKTIKEFLKLNVFRIVRKNRFLIMQIMKREIQSKYKGTSLGFLWTIVVPVFLIVIYTFVFSAVMKVRWGGDADQDQLSYAFVLFTGINLYNMIAEMIVKSPTMMLNNQNYVKKVVFPLEILPISGLGSAIFNMLIGYVVLLVIYIPINGFRWTMLLLPFILLPIVLVALGVSWVLASLGVFVRDITNITQLLVTVLMFMSPIFYPISNIPVEFRAIYYLNPLTYAVSHVRQVLLFNQVPPAAEYFGMLAAGLLFAHFSCFWFLKTKSGFADVM